MVNNRPFYYLILFARHSREDIDFHFLHMLLHSKCFVDVNISELAITRADNAVGFTLQKQFHSSDNNGTD